MNNFYIFMSCLVLGLIAFIIIYILTHTIQLGAFIIALVGLVFLFTTGGFFLGRIH